MALLSRSNTDAISFNSDVLPYLGLIDPLTLFNFHVTAFCSPATLHSVELGCITSNLPDVAFNVFHRLKYYLIRLTFLTTYNFIFRTGTQIKFFFLIVMHLQRLDVW